MIKKLVKKEIKEFVRETEKSYGIVTLEGYKWFMPKKSSEEPFKVENKWYIDVEEWSWKAKLKAELEDNNITTKVPEIKDSYILNRVISNLKDIVKELESLNK